MRHTQPRRADSGGDPIGPSSSSAVLDSTTASAPLPEFSMRTGRGMLRTRGRMIPVSEDRARLVAREQNSIVVGMLPFDPGESPLLCVPEGFEWVDPEPRDETASPVAAPTSAIGLDSPKYRKAVASAVARIHQGTLEKVVLSRALELVYDDAELDPTAVYRNLLALYPSAYVFSVRDPDTGDYLMGASPELVLGVHEGQCTTHPLAGSSPRQLSDGPTEDAQAGERLLGSAKDRAEHATVVDDIAERLGSLCDSLTIPPAPTLLGTPQLWHLGTPMSGNLKPGLTALDAARAVHPTPAICGMPRAVALDMIRELEPYDRGYYGGLVGWMDPDGNGEWALNLRSGRVSSRRATLCAGAGIVDGSTASGEHDETAVKLSTFLAALGLELGDVEGLAR